MSNFHSAMAVLDASTLILQSYEKTFISRHFEAFFLTSLANIKIFLYICISLRLRYQVYKKLISTAKYWRNSLSLY